MFKPGRTNDLMWDYLDHLALGCDSPTQAPDDLDEYNVECNHEWVEEFYDEACTKLACRYCCLCHDVDEGEYDWMDDGRL